MQPLGGCLAWIAVFSAATATRASIERLIALQRALSVPPYRPAIVHGFGGIGKSTLARENAFASQQAV